MRELIKSEELLPEIIGARDGNIWIKECSAGQADALVVEHHYSHKATSNRFASFLVNDGQGVMQLGYGIRPKMKHTISHLIKDGNYCEFDRMWLSDDLPKFSESRVIGLLLWYIKFKWPGIKFVITYADGSAGNSGTIYRATNAIELPGKDVDFYILPSGERLHPVTAWHRHGTRVFSKLQEIYPGIVRIRSGRVHGYTGQPWIDISKLTGAKQRRFLYILDKKTRKQFNAGLA